MCNKKGKGATNALFKVWFTFEYERGAIWTVTGKRLKDSPRVDQVFKSSYFLSKTVSMEVDIGSAVSSISGVEYKKSFKNIKSQPTYLKIYSGEPLPLLGEVQVAVKYQTQEMQQTLKVIGVSLGEGVPVYNNSLTTGTTVRIFSGLDGQWRRWGTL